MQGEGEIRAPGAEVDDAQLPGRKLVEHVADELDEAIHLAELVVAAARTFPSGVITPSSTRNGTGVPSGSTRRFTRSWPRCAWGLVAGRRSSFGLLPPGQHLPVGVGRAEQALAETAAEQVGRAGARSRPGRERLVDRSASRGETPPVTAASPARRPGRP